MPEQIQHYAARHSHESQGNNVSGTIMVPASAGRTATKKGRPKGGLCRSRRWRLFRGVVALHLARFLRCFLARLLAHLRHVVAFAHGVARRGCGAPGLVLGESGRGEQGERGRSDDQFAHEMNLQVFCTGAPQRNRAVPVPPPTVIQLSVICDAKGHLTAYFARRRPPERTPQPWPESFRRTSVEP